MISQEKTEKNTQYNPHKHHTYTLYIHILFSTTCFGDIDHVQMKNVENKRQTYRVCVVWTVFATDWPAQDDDV